MNLCLLEHYQLIRCQLYSPDFDMLNQLKFKLFSAVANYVLKFIIRNKVQRSRYHSTRNHMLASASIPDGSKANKCTCFLEPHEKEKQQHEQQSASEK